MNGAIWLLAQCRFMKKPGRMEMGAKGAKVEKAAKAKAKTVVVVGTVTDDSRLLNEQIPEGLKVAALRVSERARKRILAVLTLSILPSTLRPSPLSPHSLAHALVQLTHPLCLPLPLPFPLPPSPFTSHPEF